MKEPICFLQTYEEYLDYRDYPEGAPASRLINTQQMSRAECELITGQFFPEIHGRYHYYRITIAIQKEIDKI